MRSRLSIVLLVFCLCWQSMAFAGVNVAVADRVERAHAVLHFEGTAHHHDGHGGGIVLGDDAAAQQHAMDDACLFAPALLSQPLSAAHLPPGESPDMTERRAPEIPFIDGPERPPRLSR